MRRRRILQGAAVTATAAFLPASVRAGAVPTAAADYPQAQWFPASPANRTSANRPSDHRVDRVVIHVAQQAFTETVGIFAGPASHVSAHYVVRSGDGFVAQCVRERDIAWHAGNWDYNTRSIGIEHEGWVDRPSYFTQVMYERSAHLTADICDRYGLPRDRAHVIGHHEVPGSDHTDPGADWDWERYMRLVERAPGNGR
ncbi:N-acetylmuramoyl-L-alanine amidase [Streptomyces sp. NBC_00178]|uniref:N-acetylmuramoyl-L-alanine amidase n=1 Tax=Streptomyces sp. NBC_00178 TaxID=2975672 RepID=UPI002E2AB159|nr:N-acetylmuramoyl-L-alanine amidase [Streptomyces sp. NBC_00178]